MCGVVFFLKFYGLLQSLVNIYRCMLCVRILDSVY